MRSAFSTSRLGLITLLGGLALVVAACSSSGGASSVPSAAVSPAGPAEVTVAVANGSVGAYLTGKDGMTLYIFTPDSANTSTCVDACAAAWPPFTIGSDRTPNPGAGVTGTFTTFARPDGANQVAYNGAPLYYYKADTKAGDTTGQGVGGKWFIASPTGTVPGSAAPSPSGGGKYGY
jgi:predicted lipoprotein with Yx(FWY)xxD motif